MADTSTFTVTTDDNKTADFVGTEATVTDGHLIIRHRFAYTGGARSVAEVMVAAFPPGRWLSITRPPIT